MVMDHVLIAESSVEISGIPFWRMHSDKKSPLEILLLQTLVSFELSKQATGHLWNVT